jgi:hypothetical protein
MCLGTFWKIFSQTHLVTLISAALNIYIVEQYWSTPDLTDTFISMRQVLMVQI